MTLARDIALAFVLVLACSAALGCSKGPRKPTHRERFASKDANCREPERPQAFLYPWENRVFAPDDPKVDGCVIAVPDHLFCCPNAPRPTDQ